MPAGGMWRWSTAGTSTIMMVMEKRAAAHGGARGVRACGSVHAASRGAATGEGATHTHTCTVQACTHRQSQWCDEERQTQGE